MDALAFLKFEDWINMNEHRQDWVAVANFQKTNRSYFHTFSALIPNDPKFKANVLSNPFWEIDVDFGHPYFYKRGGSNEIFFSLGLKEEKGGIPFEPFVIRRYFHGMYPEVLELIQNFVSYHNLFFDTQSNRYLDVLKDEVVAEFFPGTTLRVKARYIKDYLAARCMILVRFHAHNRSVTKDLSQQLGRKSKKIEIKEKDRAVVIDIWTSPVGQNRTLSSLIGKDLILPFSEPLHEDYSSLKGKKEEFESFLVGYDEHGKEVYKTCDEHELTASEFLTPAFFKREVLLKYYDNPDRYSVQPLYLGSLDLWGIPYDRNREGLIVVWLGDLGRIPHNEQLHWRQYNIAPSGGISDEFFKSQLMAQFVEPKDPIYRLLQLYKEVNNLFNKRFGSDLFLPLSKEDQYVYKTIRLLTTEEQREFDEQLIGLAKVFPDSINVSLLKSHLKSQAKLREDEPPISVLKSFLVEILGLDNSQAQIITQPLRLLQSLRSMSAAHRKGDKYRKLLGKYGLTKTKPSEVFAKIVYSLIVSLTRLKEIL